jgi:predicted nuclease of restriction endonuclease-like (RecB) superfamily
LPAYKTIHVGIADVLATARTQAARHVNALMTASYWDIGRRIAEAEQKGKRRAGYGEQLLMQLSVDLTAQFGRGFSVDNLQLMRNFYLAYAVLPIPQTVSGELGFASEVIENQIYETVSRKSKKTSTSNDLSASTQIYKLDSKPVYKQTSHDLKTTLLHIANAFQLPWSAYTRLLSVRDEAARRFYETEALRGGWSIRQLDRQIGSQFYQRTALSRNKVAMLAEGQLALPSDTMHPDEVIKDPYFLEFLNLKDAYSESDLEAALIHQLEDFLLELGGDFTFVGRQRRLRIDHTWFRIDLLFYHRRLRCLVIIDLKLTDLTHADVGQMNLYCNYAETNWTIAGENPPIGLILCAHKGATMARYALDGLKNKILAGEYQTLLPAASVLEAQLDKARRAYENRFTVLPAVKPKFKAPAKKAVVKKRAPKTVAKKITPATQKTSKSTEKKTP